MTDRGLEAAYVLIKNGGNVNNDEVTNTKLQKRNAVSLEGV